MKRYSKLIVAFIPVLLSGILLMTVTMAWLAMNKENSSNGMNVSVSVTPNMIITKGSESIASITAPTESNFSVTFTDTVTSKKPATHDSTYGTYPAGLKYVADATKVDPSTGLAKSGETLSVTGVVATSASSEYYVDFEVHIASTAEEMTAMDLTAALTPTATIGGSDANKQDTLDAASIDFYLGSVSSANYKGTLNVAGLDNAANNASTTKTSVTLFTNDTIPLNTTSHIVVIMRCYVDGALLKSAGQAYINSNKVVTDEISLNVTFTATEYSGS